MVDRHNIGILEIGPEATVGTVASSLAYLRSLPVSLATLSEEPLRDDYQRQGDYSVQSIGGNHRGTLVTRHYHFGFSATVPTAAAALAAARGGSATLWDLWMAIFGMALGHVKAGGYVEATVAGSSDTVTVTDAGDGVTSFFAGGVCVFPHASGYEMGWVKAKDATPTPDEITLQMAARNTPSGAALYGGYTIGRGRNTLTPYLAYTNAAKAWTLRFVGYGGDRFIAYGCWPQNIKITGRVGGYLEIEITWAVAHWEEDTTTAPAVQSWSYPPPQRIRQWDIRLGASPSPLQIRTQQFDIDFGLSLQPQEGGHSDSGVEDWYYEMRQPRVSLQVFRGTLDEITLYTAQTAQPLQLSVGTQPGQMFGCLLPAARLDGYPGRTEAAGAVKADLTFRPDYYEGDTGSLAADDVADTDFRVAFA